MSWTKLNKSTRSLLFAGAVTSLATVGLWLGVQTNSVGAAEKSSSPNVVPAATFNADAGSLGAIADATSCGPTPGTPKNVTFTTSGLSGNVSSVDISMTFGGPNHTWMGDIVATLIAPNGASHTLFGVTTSTTGTGIGDSSDLGATYVFSDAAGPVVTPSAWWAAATSAGAAAVIPAGSYRSSQIGGAGSTGATTSINPAFTGVSNANGTWTLRLTDGCTGDTGSVSAANLSVTTSAPPQAFDANTDFDGDGKTDYVVARGTTTPLAETAAPAEAAVRRNVDSSTEIKSRRRGDRSENLLAPPIYWYTQLNGSGATGVGQLGDAATDFIVTEDFDGDLRDDLTVWTEAPATQANFKILQSTTNTVRVELFGQTGDDPAVVGDYDGDGKADPAVYRCPPFDGTPGQCFFFYRGSLNNPSGAVTYVPWGFGVATDFFPYVGDFDGDGKNDFCVQRANPAATAQGQFLLLKSQGLGVEYINWGLSSDFLIPGDYDGDGKTDLCVRRTVAGARQHFILTRTGATSQVQWGVTGDTSTPGDYDGDGKTDVAIWRGSATPGESRFWILNSGNGSVTTRTWGSCPTPATCDFPVAGWSVH